MMAEKQHHEIPKAGTLMVFDQSRLEHLIKEVESMKELLQEKVDAFQKPWLTEQEAKELLGKGTTWFWERRNSGELPYQKVGKTVHYKRSDLMALLKENPRIMRQAKKNGKVDSLIP